MGREMQRRKCPTSPRYWESCAEFHLRSKGHRRGHDRTHHWLERSGWEWRWGSRERSLQEQLGTLDPAVHEGTEGRDQTDLVGGHHQKRRVQSAALMNQHVGTARPSQRTKRKKRSVPICVSVIGNDNSFVRGPKRGHDDLEKLPTQVKRERETKRLTCVVFEPGAAHISRHLWCGETLRANGGTIETAS
jgi:hypothetical protein